MFASKARFGPRPVGQGFKRGRWLGRGGGGWVGVPDPEGRLGLVERRRHEGVLRLGEDFHAHGTHLLGRGVPALGGQLGGDPLHPRHGAGLVVGKDWRGLQRRGGHHGLEATARQQEDDLDRSQ